MALYGCLVEGVALIDPLDDPALYAAVYASLKPVTEAMLRAYKNALRNYIDRIPEAERVKRWGKPRPARGYNISIEEKAQIRWQAMLHAAFTKEAIALHHKNFDNGGGHD